MIHNSGLVKRLVPIDLIFSETNIVKKQSKYYQEIDI